ncbi:hypothetical protein OSB04_029973 [Centaurea solstitialis]|uniref:Uncharacterized protein n=1 Tax=Centaurea solstitialis TaxID=347529 RepID=A0AA38S6N5_9ASTR|nr:hypothetical protein OSB04_029973 [Centaurea solstitialis]
MSVVGFDLGNKSCVVAVASQSGINVALNERSTCETPALVCFDSEQRYFGTTGAALTDIVRPDVIISQIKRLIGRSFSDPELQQDLKAFPFRVTKGPGDYPLIKVGETRSFTPTQVMGMIFSNMKTIAEKNLKANVGDCCIGIPIYFTDLQRRAVMDAAKIAGLNPLRLMHETTASALAYAIYKSGLPENEQQLNVAFVDIGHASMQVCIAGLKRGQLKILAHAYDRCLGGRDFDEALFQHFAKQFRLEYEIDVFQSARASIKLRAACEELKKTLSGMSEAPLKIDNLMDGRNVIGSMRRDEFEQISTPILKRVKEPLEKAFSEAKLTVDDVYAVEIVGSGSRIPAVIRILKDFLGKEPRRTMDESEGVCIGCALECALRSLTFNARGFQVQESFPLPISMTWSGLAQDSQFKMIDQQLSHTVFLKGDPIPSVKALTYSTTRTFTIMDVRYADVTGLQPPPMISTYTTGRFQSSKCDSFKVKVKARLNLHGIFSVVSAQLIEEEKIDVPIYEKVYGGMTPSDVQRAIEKESEMALQDRTMEEIKEKRRALESYLNDMKIKVLDHNLLEFATDADREALRAKLKETEDWLEEQFFRGKDTDETKRACIDKLEELKKGECSSSNPSLCKEDPPREKVDHYQSQKLLVREVIDYQRNAGKYPTANRQLRLLIDEYSKIHRRVMKGETVELFKEQFGVYKMVVHFLEDGIIVDSSSDSE